jgi:hypothetical protein
MTVTENGAGWSRPRGRRSVDLAGPSAEPLPTGDRARHLTVAEARARELPRVSPTDALELAILIARKDPRRHPRVAARWLLRYLEEHPRPRSTRQCLPRPALLPSEATARRTPRRHYGPWPKGRRDGELRLLIRRGRSLLIPVTEVERYPRQVSRSSRDGCRSGRGVQLRARKIRPRRARDGRGVSVAGLLPGALAHRRLRRSRTPAPDSRGRGGSPLSSGSHPRACARAVNRRRPEVLTLDGRPGSVTRPAALRHARSALAGDSMGGTSATHGGRLGDRQQLSLPGSCTR